MANYFLRWIYVGAQRHKVSSETTRLRAQPSSSPSGPSRARERCRWPGGSLLRRAPCSPCPCPTAASPPRLASPSRPSFWPLRTLHLLRQQNRSPKGERIGWVFLCWARYQGLLGARDAGGRSLASKIRRLQAAHGVLTAQLVSLETTSSV